MITVNNSTGNSKRTLKTKSRQTDWGFRTWRVSTPWVPGLLFYLPYPSSLGTGRPVTRTANRYRGNKIKQNQKALSGQRGSSVRPSGSPRPAPHPSHQWAAWYRCVEHSLSSGSKRPRPGAFAHLPTPQQQVAQGAAFTPLYRAFTKSRQPISQLRVKDWFYKTKNKIFYNWKMSSLQWQDTRSMAMNWLHFCIPTMDQWKLKSQT